MGVAYALAGACLLVTPAVAKTAAEYYQGKTVTYVVATSAGGGYDVYGRLIARYMEPALPGTTIVVKNMPGAGHMVGANAIYAAKPNGRTIGTFSTGLVYAQLAEVPGVKFDLGKMSWIGKAASDPHVVITSALSPYASFDDLRKATAPIRVSAGGVGAFAYTEMLMLSRAFHLNINMVLGYTGTDTEMAMRRNEIDANLGSRSSYRAFVNSGYGRFVLQLGGTPPPGVTAARDVAVDHDEKATVALIESQTELGRFTAGPPHIPADRLELLRQAYHVALENPDLRKEAEQLGRTIDPLYGDQVKRRIKAALDQSPEIIALVKEITKAK
jgi:tripartite-type tricarboxylate transporter receptor subunit TctC